MEKVPTKILSIQRITTRFSAVVAVLWAAFGLILGLTPIPGIVDAHIVHPIEFSVRAIVGKDALMADSLRIIALDDSSYASLGGPSLNEEQWSKLLSGLGALNPKAIFTTHMFGSGEFSGIDGRLAQTLKTLKETGVPVNVAAFTYPGLIKHRPPLLLSDNNFDLQRMVSDASVSASQISKIRDLTVEHRGWNLYGPTAEFSELFGNIGHVRYDGLGKVIPLARFRGDRVVPYLGILAGGQLSIAEERLQTTRSNYVPIDADGQMLANILQPQTLREYSWSLKAIFNRIDEGTLAEIIQPGNTILILSDMYTGRVSFVPSPRGLVPSGYIVASVINSALTDRWITTYGSDFVIIPLVAALAAVIFSLGSNLFVGFSLFFGSLIIPAFGVGLFVSLNTTTPWFGAAFTFFAVGFTIAIRRSVIFASANRSERLQQAAEASKLLTIVRTTQMLAHDIRRPFSLIDTAIQAIRMEAEPRKLQSLVARLAPEVLSAKSSVEAMLTDLVEIDSTSIPNFQTVGPGELTIQALREAFTANRNSDVEISGTLGNTLEIKAERSRLQRVITNIIENAIHAMDGRGQLWVKTDDVHANGKSFVRFCIGNSGSFIPESERNRIFEAFVTKGKTSGTGLGLAIAKKIVTAHGGQIWCDSSFDNGTEFWFTIAAAFSTPRAEKLTLPKSSKEAQTQNIIRFLPMLAVIDDSPFVLEAWQMTARDAKVFAYSSPEDFWTAMKETPTIFDQLDCIVTDYHFDATTTENGVTFAAAIKAKVKEGHQLTVLISTDGIMNLDPLDKSIDAQIPKQPVAFTALRKYTKRVS